MKLEAVVKKEIHAKLKTLERFGHILWYERLQSGQIHNGDQHVYMCRPGTPDFICVLVNKRGVLTVLFIEAKREGVFLARKGVQQQWHDKYYNLHTDMIYIIAQSVDDMMETILHVGIDRVEAIEFNP